MAAAFEGVNARATATVVLTLGAGSVWSAGDELIKTKTMETPARRERK